jgi:hypothetical protein
MHTCPSEREADAMLGRFGFECILFFTGVIGLVTMTVPLIYAVPIMVPLWWLWVKAFYMVGVAGIFGALLPLLGHQ